MASKQSRRRQHRAGSIIGAFAWRLVEMLESPAHRALSLSARRVLDRLEIELARHCGKPEHNGLLPCTYEHFVEFGIERHAIGPAIRECVALGFVEITREGCAGNAGFRRPTLYRITYRHAGHEKRITDEWRRISTDEEAEAITKAARSSRPEKRGVKIEAPVRETPTGASVGNPTNGAHSPVRETPTTGPVGETPTTSISRAGSRYATSATPDVLLGPTSIVPPCHAPPPADAPPTACAALHLAEPSFPRTSTPAAVLPFRMVDAVYSIAGRRDPVIVLNPKTAKEMTP